MSTSDDLADQACFRKAWFRDMLAMSEDSLHMIQEEAGKDTADAADCQNKHENADAALYVLNLKPVLDEWKQRLAEKCGAYDELPKFLESVASSPVDALNEAIENIWTAATEAQRVSRLLRHPDCLLRGVEIQATNALLHAEDARSLARKWVSDAHAHRVNAILEITDVYEFLARVIQLLDSEYLTAVSNESASIVTPSIVRLKHRINETSITRSCVRYLGVSILKAIERSCLDTDTYGEEGDHSLVLINREFERYDIEVVAHLLELFAAQSVSLSVENIVSFSDAIACHILEPWIIEKMKLRTTNDIAEVIMTALILRCSSAIDKNIRKRVWQTALTHLRSAGSHDIASIIHKIPSRRYRNETTYIDTLADKMAMPASWCLDGGDKYNEESVSDSSESRHAFLYRWKKFRKICHALCEEKNGDVIVCHPWMWGTLERRARKYVHELDNDGGIATHGSKRRRKMIWP